MRRLVLAPPDTWDLHRAQAPDDLVFRGSEDEAFDERREDDLYAGKRRRTGRPSVVRGKTEELEKRTHF
jgi:hypothetical protein